MSSLAFVTHPSVRIKGTENSYTPSQCLDERCPVKAPHLHCPFCVKTDAYQDPVILKAHYRVKHVDKGIEFAGLKILRCCDQCDIIGIIKGEKRFKGAHWHCYRCRNGFNRRDEAIKHYKTHFRNPQTTFQIQITQDLNSPPEARSHDEHGASQDAFASIENSVQEIIQPSLSQTGLTTAEQNVITTGTISMRHNGGVKKIKVKHELLGKEEPGDHEDEETIMIIQGDQIESAFANHIINSGELTVLNRAVDPNLSWEIRYRLEEEEKNIYKAKAEEYKAQVDLLEQQVAHLETQLSQQSQLKFHELTEILNSGDFSKQGLGQQLIKFLEHCQLQAHGSIAVIEEESPMSIKLHERLKPEESIIQELEHNPNSLQGSEQQHLETECTVTHLSEIPNGYHVVCTTSEGHMVVTHGSSSTVASSLAEGETVVPVECQDNFCPSTAISTSVVSEHTEVLFSHAISSHIKEETTNSEYSECVVSQVEHGEEVDVGSDHSCLLEVVSTDEGLASLDADITVASSTFDGHDSQAAFVMDAEVEQRVVAPPEESGEAKVEDSVEEEQLLTTEPPAKRAKVT